MGVQIIGFPNLCGSTLVGVTIEKQQQNRTEREHIRKNIDRFSKDNASVTVNYTVSNISPQLSYIFVADILDLLNNSKAKNESLFSECFLVNLLN